MASSPFDSGIFQAFKMAPNCRRFHLSAWNTFSTQWKAKLDALALAFDPIGVDVYKVLSIPTEGGTPTILASGNGWTNHLTIDGTHVYWTLGSIIQSGCSSDGAVLKVPLDGGPATTLATGRNNPDSIAVNGTNVSWIETFWQQVMSVPVEGGALTILASDPSYPRAVAMDATNIYWASEQVIKVPLHGGTPTILASGLVYPGHIAVDATSIYWVDRGQNQGDGKVMKLRVH
jgi:hypothetical protein